MKNLWFVLLSGFISFVIFIGLTIGINLTLDLFQDKNMMEAYLFTDSFLKLAGLILFGCWFWLSGHFLKKVKLKSWGKKSFYLYLAGSILPYLFSFLIPTN